MGILSDLAKGMAGGLGGLNSGISRVPLEQAKNVGVAPDKMGCYKIYCNGALKYVGKAEDGIRKRFVQYYNGTTSSYSSGRKIHENRDNIKVSWVVCKTREECRSLEAQWIRQYNPEWNKQSGWGGY